MLAAFALLRAPVFGTSLLFLLLTADEPIAGRVAIGFTNGFVLFLFAALLCSLVFHSTHFCYLLIFKILKLNRYAIYNNSFSIINARIFISSPSLQIFYSI